MIDHDVFLSYSSKDKNIADATCSFLEREKIRCWIAPRDVSPGIDYAESLINAINVSKVMVLIFSSNSNYSSHVLREVERAVSKGIPIIPFRTENVPLSPSMEYYISSPHWLDALTPPLEVHIDKLVLTLKNILKYTESKPVYPNEIENNYITESDSMLEQEAYCFLNSGRYREACSIYEKLFTKGYQRGLTSYNIGYCSEFNREGVRRGPGAELKKALKYYELSIEYDYEKKEDSMLNLSTVANALGDVNKAEQYAKMVIEIAPYWFQAYGHLGYILLNSGRFEEAIPVLKQCLQIEKCDVAAMYNLGYALNKISQKEEALKYYTDFVENFERCEKEVPSIAAKMKDLLPEARSAKQKLQYEIAYLKNNPKN
ncbi:MAG: toll/interleukin-1 receptor domain-containing protein [bacterium]